MTMFPSEATEVAVYPRTNVLEYQNTILYQELVNEVKAIVDDNLLLMMRMSKDDRKTKIINSTIGTTIGIDNMLKAWITVEGSHEDRKIKQQLLDEIYHSIIAYFYNSVNTLLNNYKRNEEE